jgi:RNA polymerase sigma-70 factor (ECF subfamily)
MIQDTPVSLLERLRRQPDPEAWQRLIDLYTPLIQGMTRRSGLQAADADDLTQEVLRVVIQELPHFRHDFRKGAFRRWLRNIVVNRLRTFWRTRRQQPEAAGAGPAENLLDQLADPESDLSRQWDEEHDRYVTRRLLELLAPEFEPATWQAFQMLVMEGKKTAEVAAALGLSVNAVRIAKSRVLSRFRKEIEGLIE